MDKKFQVMQYLKTNLFMSEMDILKFASTAPHRYKFYQIAKRNGKGFRDISHPSSELKYIQSILSKKLEEIFPIHGKAIAYRRNLSIKDNALLHVGNRYLLKLDLEDFFPSIDDELISLMLVKNDIYLSDIDLELFLNLVLLKKKRKRKRTLTIGAPTSPIISNFIMYIFDCEMDNFCESKKIAYSRYADDLSFSSQNKNDLYLIENFAKAIFKEYYSNKLHINNQKTTFVHKGNNRFLTGVKINEEDNITLGRNKKRDIYACVHNILVKKKYTDIDFLQSLIGKINFFIFIQPSFENELNKKYKINVLEELKNIGRSIPPKEKSS
ncbi:hypothetical protein MWMV7_MWMV7_02143 [Acinetobacter calcoaceticus]|nr:hypothetical protein MWMV7_MWMV7_02143 [Acinetobacter calcoaceticus]